MRTPQKFTKDKQGRIDDGGRVTVSLGHDGRRVCNVQSAVHCVAQLHCHLSDVSVQEKNKGEFEFPTSGLIFQEKGTSELAGRLILRWDGRVAIRDSTPRNPGGLEVTVALPESSGVVLRIFFCECK